MESSELSNFVCPDCRASTIAFTANYERVQYVQGQLKRYSSMSSTSNTEKGKPDNERPVPSLKPMSSKAIRPNKLVTKEPYSKTESAMKFKLGDQMMFVSSGKLIHGLIDGLIVSKQGKYQIKTTEGEIFKIFHLLVLRDDENRA